MDKNLSDNRLPGYAIPRAEFSKIMQEDRAIFAYRSLRLLQAMPRIGSVAVFYPEDSDTLNGAAEATEVLVGLVSRVVAPSFVAMMGQLLPGLTGAEKDDSSIPRIEVIKLAVLRDLPDDADLYTVDTVGVEEAALAKNEQADDAAAQ